MADASSAVTRLVLGPLQTNCYLVQCLDTGVALAIDPSDEPESILETAQKKGGRIEQILLTHAHPDHLGGLPGLRRATGAHVLLHSLDTQLLRQYSRYYGLDPQELPDLLPDVELTDGSEIAVGHLAGKVIHTPGHTPGSITLQVGEDLFTGDTLFAQGVGRVDLPGGSAADLLESIRRLFTLPDHYTIHPGHGSRSSIGAEKRSNPYA